MYILGGFKLGELDSMLWYCQNCKSIMYKESFFCKDLVKDLPPIMTGYWSSDEKRTCKKCGWREVPKQ